MDEGTTDSRVIDGRVQHVQINGPYDGWHDSSYWVVAYVVNNERYSVISAHKIPQAAEGDTVHITYKEKFYKGAIQNRITELEVLERASFDPRDMALRLQEIRMLAMQAAVTLLASGGVQQEESLIAQCEALADQFLDYASRHQAVNFYHEK